MLKLQIVNISLTDKNNVSPPGKTVWLVLLLSAQGSRWEWQCVCLHPLLQTSEERDRFQCRAVNSSFSSHGLQNQDKWETPRSEETQGDMT